MTAYSAVNGVPMSASKFLVDTIARRTYGLDGYVTGDCGAISDIVQDIIMQKAMKKQQQWVLNQELTPIAAAFIQTSALDALKEGLITEADIDKALVNIFTIRMRLGEFDPRNIVPYAGIKPGIINDPSHNDLAVEIATKTPVLLKNDDCFKNRKKSIAS